MEMTKDQAWIQRENQFKILQTSVNARPSSQPACLPACLPPSLPFSHLLPPYPSSSSSPTNGLQSLRSFIYPLAVCPDNINILWGRSQVSNRRPNCTMGEITYPLMCRQPLALRARPCAWPLPFSSDPALSHCLES